MTIRREPAIAGEDLEFGAPVHAIGDRYFAASIDQMAGVVVRQRGAGDQVDAGQPFALQTEGLIILLGAGGTRPVTLRNGRISDAKIHL